MLTTENALKLMRESLIGTIDGQIEYKTRSGHSRFFVMYKTHWDNTVLAEVLADYVSLGWKIEESPNNEIFFSL